MAVSKKKLITNKKTRKKLHIDNNLTKNEMSTKKDLRTILAGYVRTQNFDSIPEWLEMYKKDFPGALDKEVLNSLLSQTLYINFKSKREINKYLEMVLSDNSELDFNETTYTAFIRIYSDKRYSNPEEIMKYIHLMFIKDIKIKRRTLAPVLNLCKETKNSELGMSIFGIAKSRNLELADADYMNLLTSVFNKKNIFNIIIIIDDMIKNNYILENSCIDVLDSIFLKNIMINVLENGNIEEDIPIKKLPAFQFSSAELSLFSDKIETHVGNIHPKKKLLLLKFRKFLDINMKKYDTVIDGANVGFYKQGANAGKVLNFNQINLFVDKALSIGRKPLLILHERHIKNINKKDLPVLNEIKKKILFFFSPSGNDDDMYWLYSSIINPKAQIITNDEMRNHIVNISIGNIFNEWKKYKVIKYDVRQEEVTLRIPSKYMIRPIMKENNLIIPFKDSGNRILWKYYTY